MEDQYDKPMTFDESLIPAHVAPIAAGEEIGSWGYGVSMLCCCSGPQEGGGDTLLDGQHVQVYIQGGDGGHKGLPA